MNTIYSDNSPHFQFAVPRLTNGVKFLLISNIAVFLLSLLFRKTIWLGFGLVTDAVFLKGMLWQLVTYTFVHSGIFHLLFNLLVIWMFGTEVEETLGTRSFLIFYFLVGACSGLLACVISWGNPAIIVGASGSVFGIFTAYAVLFPERLITLLLFFVMPVSMKAKYLVAILGGMELLFILSNPLGGVARFAHLGGIFFGFLFIRKEELFVGILRKVRMRKRPKLRIVIKSNFNQEQYISEKIDPLLDKIAKRGMKSLTRKERKKLQQARDKLEKDK
ncbi:MAG: rhomboid family intramembrane serine protease [Candidatus Theseobacter exili]|nr:rhomboid family intramembrane serine protease [Candidatus Theseobacter exili]